MGKKTKITTLSGGSRGYRKPTSFRMAYSLNNHQPVACTIISDQPFFYMDEEMIMEEDSILSDDIFSDFDELGGEFLEQEIAALKNKIDAYEKVTSEFAQPCDARLEKFIQDSAAFGMTPALQNNHEQILETIKSALMESRFSAELLSFANKHDVQLVITTETQTVSYDKKAGKILIRPDLDFVDQVLLTVQELRRHWQQRQGALVHPLTFHPDQAVLINRAQLADLAVAIVRTAWELKLQNKKEFWARIEHSSMADLGRAFARESLSDFRTLNNGKASAAVFETWFLSERCRHQDKKLIQAMLADYRGYVFDNAEASKMVSIDLICALGEQPFGKNYLAGYAQMILNDPLFTDVRDRSNANFLWFIKFERSFVETEQELQSSRHTNKSGVDQTGNNDITEDTNHENYERRAASDRLHQNNAGDEITPPRNNVIQVRFGQTDKTREGVLS